MAGAGEYQLLTLILTLSRNVIGVITCKVTRGKGIIVFGADKGSLIGYVAGKFCRKRQGVGAVVGIAVSGIGITTSTLEIK